MNKKSLSKKAQWQSLADLLLGGTLIIIAVVSFIIWVSYHDSIIEERVEARTEALNNDDVLLSLLNTEVEGSTLSEHIIMAHLNDDTAELQPLLDAFLEDAYEYRTCWIMYRGDEEWMAQQDCSDEAELLDSSIDLPLPDKTTLNIALYIYGYGND